MWESKRQLKQEIETLNQKLNSKERSLKRSLNWWVYNQAKLERSYNHLDRDNKEVLTATASVTIEHGYVDGRPLVFIRPYDGSGLIMKDALSLRDAYNWLYQQLTDYNEGFKDGTKFTIVIGTCFIILFGLLGTLLLTLLGVF